MGAAHARVCVLFLLSFVFVFLVLALLRALARALSHSFPSSHAPSLLSAFGCCKSSLSHAVPLRLPQKPVFDANKLYTSELIAVLMQDSDANRCVYAPLPVARALRAVCWPALLRFSRHFWASNRNKLGESGGIDVLLQALALYKKNDPQSDEEAEMVENLFDVLCSVIMLEGKAGRV